MWLVEASVGYEDGRAGSIKDEFLKLQDVTRQALRERQAALVNVLRLSHRDGKVEAINPLLELD